MKNLKSNILKLGMLILMMVGSAFAQMHEGGYRDMGMGRKHLPILSHAEELGLSEKQVKELKNMHHEFLKKSIEVDSKLKILELEFKKSMMDGASEKELNKQVDNIADKMASKRKLRVSMHFNVKKTISEEQWTKWKKSMHGGMMDKMKRMKKGIKHPMHKEM